MTPEQKRRKLILMQQQARTSQPSRAADRIAAAKAGTLEASPESLARTAEADRKAMPVAPIIGRENIEAVIHGRERMGEKAAAVLNKAGESLTLGLVGDEAAGAFDEMIGRGSREERTQFYRDQEDQLRQENPGLAFVAEVAPAFVPGAGAAGAVSKLSNVVGRTAAGATTGALAAGTYGFMEGDDGNRAEAARNSALMGAVFGAAAPKVTDFAASIPGRVKRLFSTSAKRPTVEVLRATKNAAYQAVDDAGEVFDGDTMTALSQRVRDTFEAGNYVEDTDSALRATLKLLERREGQPTKLGQLDRIRQNLWKRYSNAKDQPQILDAISAIDDVIDGRADTSELMGVARAANARFAKSQLLEDAFQKAQDQTAATGSGGNILNKYRQAVTSIINNEKRAKFFTAEELDVMRAFVRGSTSENMKRLVGKLSPSGNGLMMALHVIGGVASQGASLPLMAAGAVAKSSADRGAMRGADAIQDLVAGVPRPSLPPSSGAALAVGSAPVAEQMQGVSENMLRLFQSAPR
jgi:hypothetical protein